MAIFSRFFGNAVSTAAGTSIGQATGAAITPKLQQYANELWNEFPNLPIIAYALAEGVSQGQVTRAWAEAEALNTGVNAERFDRLVDIANTGPGVSVGLMLWRRGFTDEAGFRRTAKRQGLEQEWIDDLVRTFIDLLDPADIARGIHRGLIPDPGLLKGTLPSGEGNVPAYPVYPIDALAEALGNGLDRDRLGVLVGLQGLPMGSHEAAQALFRGVLDENDYLRAIAEGNTRNEWAGPIKEQSRQIPTTHEFVENALRGYSTLADAIAGGAKHGMTPEYVTMVYQNAGRPMNVHQITTGLARGGKFQPEAGELTDPYMASIVEGSLKPAYYDLAKANRYVMPSTFAIRALAQSGVWDFDKTKTRLLWAGWIPEDADDVAKAWTADRAAVADKHIAAAETKFLTAIHKAFVGGAITDAQGVEQIALTSLSAATQTGVLGYWRKERALELIPPPPPPPA